MTAKEYLEQAVLLDEQISRKIDRLGDLQAQITRSTTVLSMTPGAGHNNRSFEDRMERFLLLRDEINADINRLVDLKQEIQQTIDALPEEKYRIVLEKHFLRGFSYAAIGDELGYHERYVKDLAKKACELLKFPKLSTKSPQTSHTST